MTKHNTFAAVESLLDFIQLDKEEIEQIFNALNETDLKVIGDEINELSNDSNKEIDEKMILRWLKTLQQQSPGKSAILHEVIVKNSTLFNYRGYCERVVTHLFCNIFLIFID